MREPIILGYHAVSADWNVPLAVTPAQLEQQIRWLIRLGYRPARFTDAILAPQHDRTFVVTFDDAYRSVLERAAPVLDRLGVPATLFVPTGWVGDEHRHALWEGMEQWRRAGKDDELRLMSWDEIRRLARHGWEIGSHTVRHPYLTRLDDGALDEELTRSREAVEVEVDGPCRSIAYPYGDVDDRVAHAAARAGYATGVTLLSARRSTMRPSSTLRWRRGGVYRADGTVRFGLKLAMMARSSPSASTPAAATARASTTLVAPGSAAARVAVVVPCFNDGALALEAVASISEDEPIEVIVVDDASNDPSTATALDELRSRGVVVLRHDINMGLSAARCTGLDATSAPFVFPLDSDDLVVPGALARLADRLDADHVAVASFGDEEEFGTRSRRVAAPVDLDAYRVAFRNEYPVSSLFRRSALEEVGGWRDVGDMVGYEDWHLWMTIAERGDTAVHAGFGFTTIRRRLHGPRMLGESGTRHRELYAELRRTHPRLFSELADHRRRSSLSPPLRVIYPFLFGGRPPLGIRQFWWGLSTRVGRALATGPR